MQRLIAGRRSFLPPGSERQQVESVGEKAKLVKAVKGSERPCGERLQVTAMKRQWKAVK